MTNLRQTCCDFALYLLVRIIVCIVQMFPLTAALSFADSLGWLVYKINRRHRRVADENLRHAFPEMDEEARDRVVRACYRHLFRLVMEILFLPRLMRPTKLHQIVDIRDIPDLADLFTNGRPLILVTGHVGNWELASYILGLIGLRSYAIARRLDNPYLNGFLEKLRSGTGQTILDKNSDYERIKEVLAQGQILGILVDQDAGQKGLFVPFFGRPASTFKAPALLALEYNAPMVVIAAVRIGEPLRYQSVVEEVIFPEEYQDNPDAVKRITERYSAALERIIRRHPEQYFWLHRRWKHQPKEREKKKAA
jgi:KDO2-lipid IV(A) lauroyltransferase